MFTGLLYYGWGLGGYDSVRTDDHNGQMIFTLEIEDAPGGRGEPGCPGRHLPEGGRGQASD